MAVTWLKPLNIAPPYKHKAANKLLGTKQGSNSYLFNLRRHFQADDTVEQPSTVAATQEHQRVDPRSQTLGCVPVSTIIAISASVATAIAAISTSTVPT